MLQIEREEECPSGGSMLTLIMIQVSLTGIFSPVVRQKELSSPDQDPTRRMITISQNRRTQSHIRAVIGHLRYNTEKELVLINSLYRNELRLYKNFFQPVMKLKEKIWEKRKVYRKYDVPKTPIRG